jgi:hypothetical protein
MLLCSLAPCIAATTAADALANDPVSGLTAEQAVKMGVDTFINTYEQKTQDLSTAGLCNAYLTYARLRRYINDRGAGKRTPAQQALIEHLRSCCANIEMSYIENGEASLGGGTIFRTQYAFGMIDVETTIGKVILSMEKPKPNAQGRRDAVKKLTSLLADMKNLTPPFSDDDDKASAATWKEHHQAALTRLRTEVPHLQQLMKSAPDNACVALAGFVDEASENGYEYL